MKGLMNMKARVLVILTVFFSAQVGFAQYRLRDVPFDLATINRRSALGKQGTWFFYNKSDSTVFAMENYRNDTLNGYFERYWQNGEISEKGFYKKGKLDSIFIGYWENGVKRGVAYYINGSLNGIVTSFNQKNEITSRLKYLNDVIDSSYTESFVDSNLVWDNQIRSKVDTVKTTYKSDWNKKYAIYSNDSLIQEISFYKDVMTINNYYERSMLSKRIVYSRVKPYSIEKIFYYKNGLLNKTEFYDKNGVLILTK